MRMTPLDIRNHHFERRWMGYDAADVDQFLTLIVEDYEGVCREADELRSRVRELESQVEKLNANEQTLRETLVTAQGMSEDLKRTAQKEAEVRIGEAEVRAEKILDAAHRQAARLAEDIRELRVLRKRVAAAVRTTIETHLALLDGISDENDQDFAEAEPRGVTPLRYVEPAPKSQSATAKPPQQKDAAAGGEPATSQPKPTSA